jgi:glycerol-3-phosphate acyltransferase PlsY
MFDILIGLAALLIGYLVGSLSFPRIVTTIVSPGLDLENTVVPVEGSDDEIAMTSVSATSVRFQLGSKYGCLSSFLDMLKVAAPVFLFQYLFPETQANILAAMGGILGHNWPVYYKFRGGYGHSAIYGALFVIEWTAVPVSFLGTALFYLITRQVHIAAFGGILLLIPWFWFLDHDLLTLIYAGVCSGAYLIKVLPDFTAVREDDNQAADPENLVDG